MKLMFRVIGVAAALAWMAPFAGASSTGSSDTSSNFIDALMGTLPSGSAIDPGATLGASSYTASSWDVLTPAGASVASDYGGTPPSYNGYGVTSAPGVPQSTGWSSGGPQSTGWSNGSHLTSPTGAGAGAAPEPSYLFPLAGLLLAAGLYRRRRLHRVRA